MSVATRKRNAPWLPTLARAVGTGAIAVALLVWLTGLELGELVQWLWKVFGPIFTLLYTLLLLTCVYQIKRIETQPDSESRIAHIKAAHAASGISTVALTFTLLGISLGIGGLADTPVNADTATGLVAQLAGHFSTAFMTSVVGLPTAAAMRAWIAIVYEKTHQQPLRLENQTIGD